MNKQAVRERIWDRLEQEDVARFPFPPHGRIPNFKGADQAGERLCETDVFERASVMKANPDAPQRSVRTKALEQGKTLVVPSPRLKHGFYVLDPARLSIDDLSGATTISGMSEKGRSVPVNRIPEIDLIVCGSVAVDRYGGRIGKGEGYSDLEFAILNELDRLNSPEVVTTVHTIQIVDRITTEPHDVPLDAVVTPGEYLETETTHSQPEGIHWEGLTEEDLKEMPVLRKIRENSICTSNE